MILHTRLEICSQTPWKCPKPYQNNLYLIKKDVIIRKGKALRETKKSLKLVKSNPTSFGVGNILLSNSHTSTEQFQIPSSNLEAVQGRPHFEWRTVPMASYALCRSDFMTHKPNSKIAETACHLSLTFAIVSVPHNICSSPTNNRVILRPSASLALDT